MASTEQSIKAYLNSLGQLPGSILYRNKISWEALAPGTQGQVLSIDDDLMPYWRTYRDTYPAMMKYGAYLSKLQLNSFTVTNDRWTILCRWSGLTGTSASRLIFSAGGGGEAMDIIYDPSGTLLFKMRDSSNNIYLAQRSDRQYTDSKPHYLYIDYDNTNGDYTFVIDGQHVSDPTYGNKINVAATVRNGAGFRWTVGNINGLDRNYNGSLGCIGFQQGQVTNWSDFMTADGWPKPIDTVGWSQFGIRPPIWHESGAMENNRGDAGAFTKTGDVQIANPSVWS